MVVAIPEEKKKIKKEKEKATERSLVLIQTPLPTHVSVLS